MATMILPHRARYAVLGPDGGDAGVEELQVATFGAGTHITSSILTEYPASVRAEVDWELDERLRTRRLLLRSRTSWGDDCELELTVTGNGLLAHRVAPDGPTQVELGWGSSAELDYLSAAFAAVMVARSDLSSSPRRVDSVHIATEDLLPVVVSRELALLPAVGDSRVVLNRALQTGHAARLEVDASGALRDYEGMLRLERLTLSPAPTK